MRRSPDAGALLAEPVDWRQPASASHCTQVTCVATSSSAKAPRQVSNAAGSEHTQASRTPISNAKKDALGSGGLRLSRSVASQPARDQLASPI
eukprot:7387675-Prymnesium_polylepis.1